MFLTSIIHIKLLSLSNSCSGVKLNLPFKLYHMYIYKIEKLGSKMESTDRLMFYCVTINRVIVASINSPKEATLLNVKRE